MQINNDSKCKVVLYDITLWANHCTKCHGNTISCFHLIAHIYVRGGEFFTGNYILWHPPHSGIIFDLQAITTRNAIVHKVSIASVNFVAATVPQIWTGAKSSKWPVPEPKINTLRQTVEDCYCAKFQVIPIRGFRSIVLTYTLHTSWKIAVAVHVGPTSWITNKRQAGFSV